MERTMIHHCDYCKNPCRKIYRRRDKYVCQRCTRKFDTIIGSVGSPGPRKTIEEVLSCTYVVRTYNKGHGTCCVLSLPSIMGGKKFKIVLDEESE